MTASAPRRPDASPASTAPRSVTCSRDDEPGLDGARQLAAVRRLRPLVAEQRARRDRADRHLGLARPVGAEHVQVHARPQVAGLDDDLGARRDAADDVGTQRLAPCVPARPASSAASASAASGARVEADARAVAGGCHAARRPRAVQPAADDADRGCVVASQSAAPRRPRRRRCAAQSPIERRAARAARSVRASLRQTTPITVGSPARGLPGNDEIHLSIASSPPRAGIARKSPWPGLSR